METVLATQGLRLLSRARHRSRSTAASTTTPGRPLPGPISFVDIEGDVRPRPRFQTRAKMLWDDTYFYVAALLEEPHVWGTLTKHDSVIFQDNDFEIFIDPDGDNHEYYEIEINALNTEWDLFLEKPYRDGGPAINEWEIPGLKTAVHVDRARSTTRRTRIHPGRSSLRFPGRRWPSLPTAPRPRVTATSGGSISLGSNGSTRSWTASTARCRTRREDNWVWSPQGVIDMHRPERWGYVQFSTAQPGQAVYRPDPAGPIRDRLMQVYHAQKAFFKQNKRWATTLDELKLPDAPGLPEHTTKLSLVPGGYEAAITFNPPGGNPRPGRSGRIRGFRSS